MLALIPELSLSPSQDAPALQRKDPRWVLAKRAFSVQRIPDRLASLQKQTVCRVYMASTAQREASYPYLVAPQK